MAGMVSAAPVFVEAVCKEVRNKGSEHLNIAYNMDCKVAVFLQQSGEDT